MLLAARVDTVFSRGYNVTQSYTATKHIFKPTLILILEVKRNFSNESSEILLDITEITQNIQIFCVIAMENICKPTYFPFTLLQELKLLVKLLLWATDQVIGQPYNLSFGKTVESLTKG